MRAKAPRVRSRVGNGGNAPVATQSGLLVIFSGANTRWSPKRKHADQGASPHGNTDLSGEDYVRQKSLKRVGASSV